jgi:succinate-semialdehyde dehydrogenase / glutarate-semialdehyde dehydrogenase
VRHPKGVAGFIAPWNYPLSMAITDAIPALAAGNACVLKPAQQTPFTALWLVELAREAGLPDDLLTVVTGRGSVLGDPLIDAVDVVTFTGSTETGRQVAARAGESLTGVALELGGKNAMIVLEDADLGAAVDGAVRGCFASAGQLCISIERLLVHASIADEFTRRFVGRVNGLRLSAELSRGAATWGPSRPGRSSRR